MTYLAKAALLWDHCKTKVECSPKETLALGVEWWQDQTVKGWISLVDNHHLCANCAKAYRAKQAEFEQELKEFLNNTNEFTL